MSAPTQKVAVAAKRLLRAAKRRVLGAATAATQNEASAVADAFFDPSYYRERYPDVAASGMDPAEHYELHGRAEHRQPSPLFDPVFYLESNPRVAKSGLDPLTHFLQVGGAAGLDPVPEGFNSSWYLQQHPSVAERGLNPLVHFLEQGVHEGWDPSPMFSLDFYNRSNPDVVSTGMNPLVHWLRYGRLEGRVPHPDAVEHRSVDAFLSHLAPDLTPLIAVTGPNIRRITLVTDSIGPDSLFGGVATALVLGSLWSVRTGRSLRIATRHAPPEASALSRLFAEMGVSTELQPELAHTPAGPGDVLEVGDDDLFLTTSWWTTAAVLKSIPASRVAYILQEDERIFYPLGGSSLRASEIMNHPDLTILVNTPGLYEDLIRTGVPNLASTGTPFVPSFASFLQKGRVLTTGAEKRNLFVYARPHNPRNLFELTLRSLDRAIEEGHLPEERWNIYLVGRDVPALSFCDDRKAKRPGVLSWSDYKEMLGTIDLGISLMSSPHPSYPPLDLAASGAFVVTNTWPGKPDLTQSFDRIVMAEPTVDGLSNAIGQAARRLETEGATPFAPADTAYLRTWPANLESSVERLARTFGDV